MSSWLSRSASRCDPEIAAPLGRTSSDWWHCLRECFLLCRQHFDKPFAGSLLTGGTWRGSVLHAAGLAPDSVCARCGQLGETLQHRLWDCPRNSSIRDAYLGDIDLPELPTCLRRCGLIPASFEVGLGRKIIEYLVAVNSFATIALAERHQLQHVLPQLCGGSLPRACGGDGPSSLARDLITDSFNAQSHMHMFITNSFSAQSHMPAAAPTPRAWAPRRALRWLQLPPACAGAWPSSSA